MLRLRSDDRRAVRALHVVSQNLELWLRVDLRIVGKQQVPIGLLGIGLLRLLVDDDSPVENAVRPIIQNPVVKLAAPAMRTEVFDEHVVVQVLATLSDEKAVDQAFAAFARQNRMHVVPHQPSADQQGMRGHVCASALLDA